MNRVILFLFTAVGLMLEMGACCSSGSMADNCETKNTELAQSGFVVSDGGSFMLDGMY
jgi:hypothetical protein